MTDAKGTPVEHFYKKHCTSRTYFFQIRKCSDSSCLYHKPLRSDHTIDVVFPDPIPKEIDGVLHYQEGSDPDEKFLPSILENIEKSSHEIPFSPTGRTAENVCVLISITCIALII